MFSVTRNYFGIWNTMKYCSDCLENLAVSRNESLHGSSFPIMDCILIFDVSGHTSTCSHDIVCVVTMIRIVIDFSNKNKKY